MFYSTVGIVLPTAFWFDFIFIFCCLELGALLVPVVFFLFGDFLQTGAANQNISGQKKQSFLRGSKKMKIWK